MTIKREPFDDFLKRKIESKNFEFEESYWLEAEKLISKKKSKKYFLWLFFFILIGGLFSYITLRNNVGRLGKEQSGIDTLVKTLQDNKLMKKQLNEISPSDSNNSIISKSTKRALHGRSSINHSSSQIGINNRNPSKIKSKAIVEIIPNNSSSASIELLNQNIKGNPVSINSKKIIQDSLSRLIEIMDTLKIDSSIGINTETLPNIDSLKLNPEPIKPHLNKSNSLVLLLGSIYNHGLNPISVFSFSMGMNLEKRFNQKWNVGLGVLYFNSGKINITKVYTSTVYGFGVTNYKNTVITNRLDYIGLPFYMKGKIQKNHSVQLGVQLSFLMSSKNTIVKEIKRDLEQPQIVSYEEPRHKTGFTLVDPQLFLGYEYKKGPWALQAKYTFGLMLVASKSHFGIQQGAIYHRNLGVYLQYHFLQF